MKLRSSFAALSAAAFLLATPALAAGPTGPAAADRATARALAAEAHKAFADKDYVTAADRFARADALVHAPTLMLHLARSQAALGKIVAANESLNRILREDLPPNAPKVWTDAVEEARKELAIVAPRLSWITLNVKGAAGHEDDLHLLLDGVEVPAAALGLPRAVDAGQHVAVATMERSKKKSEATAKVGEGQTAAVQLEVTWVPPPPGTVLLPRGPGEVRMVIVPGNPTRKYIGYGALGLGGAGLVVGGVTGSLVLVKHNQLAVSCTGGKCPASEQSKLDSYNTLGLVSTVGFIAGAAIMAGGVGLVLTAPKPRQVPASTLGLNFIPTAGGGTLSAAGSF